MIFLKNKGLYKKNFYFVLLFIFMSGIEYFLIFPDFLSYLAINCTREAACNGKQT